MSIVTLTLNPALDLYATIETIEPERKLHCGPVETTPGGGGVNVARAVHRLEGSATAIVALGGTAGIGLRDQLRDEGVVVVPVEVRGTTRQDLTVTETTSGRQYRFVLPGAAIDHDEIERCAAEVMGRLDPGAIVVVSGSMPPGVEAADLAAIVTAVRERGGKAVVDTSGPLLAAAAEAGVHVLKPSLHELAAHAGRSLESLPQITGAAEQLMRSGPNTAALVSLAARGALLVARDEVPLLITPPAVAVSSVLGAGDSLVAGLVVAMQRGATLPEAARYGVACGTAAVMGAGHTLCAPADVATIVRDVVVSPLALADLSLS